MEEKKQILITFGDNVRRFRIQKGLSQEQLAHLADVHRTYIGMIERAEKNITLINIQKITNGLGVDLIDLLKDEQRADSVS
ncbi:helix-turn-helix domain-containing protein [Flavobacterium sp. H122]|uniref:helix-turn-helix domain-containing protein n=1 Tax=Flavobacterium sp. H122 TaxID=2529860 RepID=UPI0010AA1D8D|nr:helix-turn-helix transcriptional regulator [Flavobacterium sp. H122]